MQVSKKTYSITSIINSYLKGLGNQTEVEIDSNFETIKKTLETLPVVDLVSLYIQYSNSSYNAEILLNYISSLVLSKLDTISFIKIIDLYAVIFNQILLVEDTLVAEKNILSVMSFELSNEDYIEKEIKKRKISQDRFIETCKKELEIHTNSISLNEKSHNNLENFQDKILLYIKDKIKNLDFQQYKYLSENLNNRLEKISKKILEIQGYFSNPEKLIKYDVHDIIEYNNFKNNIVVYETFRDFLQKNNKNDNA